MNNCKQAHKKLRPLWSRAKQFRASLHNQGIVLANRLIFGQTTLRTSQVIFSPGGTFKYEIIGPCCRLFVAAACATPIISDYWQGLESCFELGSEILVSHSAADTLSYLQQLSDTERLAVGDRARQRVLSAHTAAHRAAELEQHAITILAA